MSGYIDVNKFRDWLGKIPLKDLSDGRGLCRVIFAEDFEDAVRNMPKNAIVDVEPVRHARWKDKVIQIGISKYHYIECPKCNSGYNIVYVHLLLGDGKLFNRCPECGAKMDGKEKEK